MVARPLLVLFWALVLWGTLYGTVFLHATFVEGPKAALARTLSRPDAGAGLLNLALAALAAVVWAFVTLAIWSNRASAEPTPGADGRDQ